MKSLSTIIQKSNNAVELAKRQDLLPSTLRKVSEIRAHFGNYESFLKRFTPDNVSSATALPEKSVLSDDSPTLTHLDLAWGDGASVSWLIIQLGAFQEKINTPNKMTPHQIESCAILIRDTFGYLKATELMLFFGRLMGGDYSVNFHGYITPTVIIDALRDYYIPYRNRVYEEEEKRKREQERLQDIIDNPPISREEYNRRHGIDNVNPLDIL